MFFVQRMDRPGRYVALDSGQKQYVEGLLRGCARSACSTSCCDNHRVEAWTPEWYAFHALQRNHFESYGVRFSQARDGRHRSDVIRFRNCSEDGRCKLILYAPDRDVDPRPIDCKIYPYAIDWESIDLRRNEVYVGFWDKTCPMIAQGIPPSFRNQVTKILRRDLARLFNNTVFDMKFTGLKVRG